MGKWIFILSCVFISLKARTAPLCEPALDTKSWVGSQCEKWKQLAKSSPFVFADVQTHSFLVNPFYSKGKTSEIAKNILVTDPLTEVRFKSNFEAMKKKLMMVIDARSEKSTELAVVLKKRIASIKLKIDNGETEECALGLLPQAVYDIKHNQIIACQTLVNAPESTIVSVLSHEMGHSMDLCMMRNSYRIDRKRLVGKQISKSIKKCLSQQSELDGANLISDIASIDSDIFIESIETPELNKLQDCGLLKLISYDEKKFPFFEQYSCYEKSYMDHPKLTHEEAYQEKNLRPKVQGTEHCHQDVMEAFADFISADIVSESVQKHVDNLSSLFFVQLAEACRDAKSFDYPNGDERVRTFIVYPKVQEVIGCSGLTKKPRCIESFNLSTEVLKKSSPKLTQ